MCSVVGYVGYRPCKALVLEGLSRLEYRGYDAAGFACIDEKTQLTAVKVNGSVQALHARIAAQSIDGTIGVGHTRWSTHGALTETNAHPHFDCSQKVAVVHNGIVENHHELRTMLLHQGHQFRSQTDTEVIAHLLEQAITEIGELSHAVHAVVRQLKGAYACIALLEQYPDVMIIIRARSPLCIGVGKHETFIASDVMAFADQTKQVIYVPDNSFGIITHQYIELYDFSGNMLEVHPQQLALEWHSLGTQGYDHYLLKEIYEQPRALRTTVASLQRCVPDFERLLGYVGGKLSSHITDVALVACGSSWHAGHIGRHYFEQIAGISTRVYLSSEFRCDAFFYSPTTLYIFISQSGETADTLEALRMVTAHGGTTLGLTNVPTSTMAREVNGILLTDAGREVSVAATKTFTTQVAALYYAAAYWAQLQKGNRQSVVINDEIFSCAATLEQVLHAHYSMVITTAQQYAQYPAVFFLGRGMSYPLAQEAALKLQEIGYVFAICYPGGELKHGPLALIDEQTPVFVFAGNEHVAYQKLVSNIHEVLARKGTVVAFVYEDQEELRTIAHTSFVFPRSDSALGIIPMTGVMQLLMYHIAVLRGCPIDKPRNLAKTLTVE